MKMSAVLGSAHNSREREGQRDEETTKGRSARPHSLIAELLDASLPSLELDPRRCRTLMVVPPFLLSPSSSDETTDRVIRPTRLERARDRPSSTSLPAPKRPLLPHLNREPTHLAPRASTLQVLRLERSAEANLTSRLELLPTLRIVDLASVEDPRAEKGTSERERRERRERRGREEGKREQKGKNSPSKPLPSLLARHLPAQPSQLNSTQPSNSSTSLERPTLNSRPRSLEPRSKTPTAPLPLTPNTSSSPAPHLNTPTHLA